LLFKPSHDFPPGKKKNMQGKKQEKLAKKNLPEKKTEKNYLKIRCLQKKAI